MTEEEAMCQWRKVALLCNKVGGEAIELAINALEKQIPRKPYYERVSFDENGNLIYYFWRCPYCAQPYKKVDKYDYCPNCGQALDWGNERVVSRRGT